MSLLLHKHGRPKGALTGLQSMQYCVYATGRRWRKSESSNGYLSCAAGEGESGEEESVAVVTMAMAATDSTCWRLSALALRSSDLRLHQAGINRKTLFKDEAESERRDRGLK
jgi:hypothetical protein